ncbi:Mu-like prophage major head subunit gpT [Klebsiella pneumoniae]|uniref:Mu-like prophage major head subunit gpT n=1 Tax=Klebsiella pneumoniae TaxID=573 RepID=A0A378C542_KLEPN|nr:Mu-like prophage major head subunit gpT [Klebsiella pneumoniae]
MRDRWPVPLLPSSLMASGLKFKENSRDCNKQNLKTIFIGLKKTFQNAFDQTPNDWQQIAMVVPSSTKEENYAWLSRFPKMP